jgi:outer membrane lipoprotein-sorting protein
MKKNFSLCLLGVFLIALVVSPGFDQEAEDILEKYIEASGGKKLLASIKDTTLTGTMEIPMAGMSGSLTIFQKEPDMIRMDMEMMGMVITQAYDGEIAWWINPQTGAVEEMPADQAQNIIRQSYGNSILLDPDKYGIIYTLKETENIEGKDYYVMEQSFPDGFTLTMYIDSKTYLPYKTVAMVNQMGVEAEAETFLSEWRKVDGMMVSFSIKVYYDGEEAVSMTFTEVKFNTGIEDSFFKME